MSNDIVSQLEDKIDELLARLDRLTKENAKLARAKGAFTEERVRCRKELKSILSKLDQLG